MKVSLRKHKHSFRDVLYNTDDQAWVRLVVEQTMPDNLKALIVELYNNEVDRRNAVVMQQVEEGWVTLA